MKVKYHPDTGRLICGRNETLLGKQTKICMDFFIEQTGSTVTKEQLHQSCWVKHGRVVSDSTVRQTLHRLRKTFRDIGIEEDVFVTHGRNQYYFLVNFIEVVTEPDVLADLDVVREDLSLKKIPQQPAISLVKKKRNPNRTHLKLLLILLVLIMSTTAGMAMRVMFFFHPISYELHHRSNERDYYFPSTFLEDRSASAKLAEYWVNYQLPDLNTSRHIYVNAVRSNMVSMIVCSNKIEDLQSTCQSLNVIGKRRK